MMSQIGHALSTLGKHGPLLLVLSLLVGIAAPQIASAAHAALPVSAFLLTLGSFLTAAFSPPEFLSRRNLAITLIWAGLGVPLVAACVLTVVPLDPMVHTGVILSIVAPPVGSAAALASMLGLLPRLALSASVGLTVVAPLSMPVLAHLLGASVTLDMAGLAVRLGLIVGTAAVLATAARRWRREVSTVLPSAQAAAGIAVIGLVIVGLATMHGVISYWRADPAAFQRLLATAIVVNVALCITGTVLFLSWGLPGALTVGLISGNRNVTLAWAAAGTALPTATETYIAACVVPVLVLPLAIRWALQGKSNLLVMLASRQSEKNVQLTGMHDVDRRTTTREPGV